MLLKKAKAESVTKILNEWILTGDIVSANRLRSIVYYHLKGIVQKQITEKAFNSNSQNLVEQLPNTTSLLHDVLASLKPPKEMFDNRQQYFLFLASLVRWMLLDEIKKRKAQKRSIDIKLVPIETYNAETPEAYLLFDNALKNLERLAPRSYRVAILHYFLGYDLEQIKNELKLEKSTVYNELSTAKAYLRTQC